MFRFQSTILILSLALVAMASGCSSYASFPPLEGDTSAAQTSHAPVPEVVATAIEWCVAREDYRQQEKPIQFQLPLGMTEDAHDEISTWLEKAGWSTSSESSDRSIKIRSIRLFGLKAMVDLSVPRGSGPDQLVTLELQSYAFQNWQVIAANRWRFNEDQLQRNHDELQQASVDVDAGS